MDDYVGHYYDDDMDATAIDDYEGNYYYDDDGMSYNFDPYLYQDDFSYNFHPLKSGEARDTKAHRVVKKGVYLQEE